MLLASRCSELSGRRGSQPSSPDFSSFSFVWFLFLRQSLSNNLGCLGTPWSLLDQASPTHRDLPALCPDRREYVSVAALLYDAHVNYA